jgi:hypothetical protein
MVEKPDTTNRCDIVQTATHSGGATYYCKTHGCMMTKGPWETTPVVCDCAVQEAKNDV